MKVNLWIYLFIAGVIGSGAVAKSHDGNVEKHSFSFSYDVMISDIPEQTEDLMVFMPVPVSDRHQEISNVVIDAPCTYEFQQDLEFGNKILAIHLTEGEVPSSISISIQFDVMRRAITGTDMYDTNKGNLEKSLQADSLIPLDDIIRKEVEIVVSPGMDSQTKAKVLYDYLLASMVYDKSGTGWGRGDAVYACNARKGNCTDFHSLFIGMSRVENIPARFQIGFPVPCDKKEGKIDGYHCWAEFYLPDKGWVPVDISEAWKDSARSDFYYGGLDACRVRLTTGRDIPVRINQNRIIKLNYFIYPYVLVNGKEYDNIQTNFFFTND